MKLTLDNCYALFAAFQELDKGLAPPTPAGAATPFTLTGNDRYNLGRNFRLVRQEVQHFETETRPDFVKEISGGADVLDPKAPNAEERQKAFRVKLTEAGKAELEIDVRPFKDGLSLDKNQISATLILAVLIEFGLLPDLTLIVPPTQPRGN